MFSFRRMSVSGARIYFSLLVSLPGDLHHMRRVFDRRSEKTSPVDNTCVLCF